MAAAETSTRPPLSAQLAAASGVLSVALLGASLRWAHHWGFQTDSLAVSWALATLTALTVSWRLRRHAYRALEKAPRLPLVGLTGGFLSLGALVVIALLYATGIDVAGACGGG